MAPAVNDFSAVAAKQRDFLPCWEIFHTSGRSAFTEQRDFQPFRHLAVRLLE
jgi:hypothetical protein